MNDLNKEYFKTRKSHKEYRKGGKKLTLKKALINLLITFIMIFLYSLLQNHLTKKIEENKRNDKELINQVN